MIKYEWIYKSVCNRKPSVFPKRTVNLNFINMSIRSINDFQMVAHTAQSNDFYIGADTDQFLAQEAYIDFYMVFYCIGVISPNPGQNHLLGKNPVPGLEQKPHHVKLPGRKTDAFLTAE